MNKNCKKIESACTIYRGCLPQDSILKGNDCVSIEETTEELYGNVTTIKQEIDLSYLGNRCLDYNPAEIGRPTVREFARKIEQEVCDLKDQNKLSQSICNISIAGCNLDLGNIVDTCGIQPQTFGELLQILINNNTTI